MKPTAVSIERTFNLGDFQSIKIRIDCFLDEGETTQHALQQPNAPSTATSSHVDNLKPRSHVQSPRLQHRSLKLLHL